MYLFRTSRSAIQFLVHQCSRFNKNPRKCHPESVKRDLLYLFGTQVQGLTFDTNSDMKMYFYVGADFAGIRKHYDNQDLVCVLSQGLGML